MVSFTIIMYDPKTMKLPRMNEIKLINTDKKCVIKNLNGYKITISKIKENYESTNIEE